MVSRLQNTLHSCFIFEPKIKMKVTQLECPSVKDMNHVPKGMKMAIPNIKLIY